MKKFKKNQKQKILRPSGQTWGIKIKIKKMYSEYHNILATMIQQKWKKFILQKKLRSFINPTEKSLKLKKKPVCSFK